MALSFLYRFIRRVIGVVRFHRIDAAAKEAETLVLRHQLAVLRRQVARPLFVPRIPSEQLMPRVGTRE